MPYCLPFQAHTTSGFEYRTLLIEPPVFLSRLESDLRTAGVTFAPLKTFASRAEIFATIPDDVIINCSGFGAKILWSDPDLIPIKGQLAMLPAQPSLQYLYGENGYLFPRSDHVVIGGTFEYDVNNEMPNKSDCVKLVSHMK